MKHEAGTATPSGVGEIGRKEQTERETVTTGNITTREPMGEASEETPITSQSRNTTTDGSTNDVKQTQINNPQDMVNTGTVIVSEIKEDPEDREVGDTSATDVTKTGPRASLNGTLHSRPLIVN